LGYEEKRAAEVNNKAEEFTLSHAVMAMRAILEQENKEQETTLRKVKEELKAGSSPITDEEYEAKRRELFRYGRYFVIVDYLNKLSPEGARTYLGNGYIEILLPDSLKKDIPKLRGLVGHELGHLALHFDELVSKVGEKNGTKVIRDLEKEAQADRFAKELIRLRDEHLRNRFSGIEQG
jgi:hypothetical protein